ncbi:hypothetical protein [Streptomyces yerevanensis]|nr:hypothetical protein [Streptomyces yerevanensis]
MVDVSQDVITSAAGCDDIDYSPFGTGPGQAVPLEDYDYGRYNQ